MNKTIKTPSNPYSNEQQSKFLLILIFMHKTIKSATNPYFNEQNNQNSF